MDSDERYMRMAMREARAAGERGEVPVGAVIVHPELGVIGKAHNQVETLKDATAHAEILAITQAAAALADWRLEDCVLYVTKEPCPMCAGAVVFSRLRKVIWGLDDPQRGGESRFGILSARESYHRPEKAGGFLGEECREEFLAFFQAVRTRSIGKPGGEDSPTPA
jgi:tRNA(adenine34) deaminase